MDFSELCKVSASQAEFSPDGKYLARVAGSQKVYLQEAESLKLVQVFSCCEDVQASSAVSHDDAGSSNLGAMDYGYKMVNLRLPIQRQF
jgi:hypothetical protein